MQDVWTLFMIMDNDQTGLVNLEEFVSGGHIHVRILYSHLFPRPFTVSRCCQ